MRPDGLPCEHAFDPLGIDARRPRLSWQTPTDVMYRIATQTTFPSWGYMIERGATTV